MTSEATRTVKRSERALLTAPNGHKEEVEPKQTKPVLSATTTLCHNTAIIFPKKLHAALPWRYQGKGADKKVHIQIDIEGGRVILSTPKPEARPKK
jgi:hypothetical protein